jgi:threonine dehydratase
VDAVKALSGEVLLHGDSYTDAYTHALALEKKRALTFVHPFDDPEVIAGQGTIAMEMLRQTRHLDAVFVAVGGGGLIAGVASYIKAVRPDIKIIGVQMTDSNAMAQSIAAGKRITLKDVGLFSDGTAVKQVGVETFRLARALVDEWVDVETDAVCAAIKDIFIENFSRKAYENFDENAEKMIISVRQTLSKRTFPLTLIFEGIGIKKYYTAIRIIKMIDESSYLSKRI